jgi:hypothetical protein
METQYIEFDYLSENQDSLIIYGERDGLNIKFKAVNEYGQIIPKSKLSRLDIEAIEDFIYENAIQEINFESDWYDRQN